MWAPDYEIAANPGGVLPMRANSYSSLVIIFSQKIPKRKAFRRPQKERLGTFCPREPGGGTCFTLGRDL